MKRNEKRFHLRIQDGNIRGIQREYIGTDAGALVAARRLAEEHFGGTWKRGEGPTIKVVQVAADSDAELYETELRL